MSCYSLLTCQSLPGSLVSLASSLKSAKSSEYKRAGQVARGHTRYICTCSNIFRNFSVLSRAKKSPPTEYEVLLVEGGFIDYIDPPRTHPHYTVEIVFCQ